MMNRKSWFKLMIFGLFPFTIFSQTNNLTGSPYSLFGLGVSTNSNIGKNSSLGRGGYALNGGDYINNYNPATFAVISDKSFMYDIGFLAEVSTVASKNNEEKRLAGNISSIALASRINDRSGFGLTLDPYTDVGYAVIGIESTIEGSFDSFVSSVFGSGSLNDLKFSYGYKVNDYLNVGLGLSYLFGNITETERISAGVSSLTVEETNRYSGGRIDIGVQGKLNDHFSLGARWQLPTSLAAKRDRKVSKILDVLPTPVVVENTSDVNIPSFDLPLEISTGFVYKPIKSLTLNFDYTKNYWGATDQDDNIGSYVDQDIFAIGAEYTKDSASYKYWERIQFRGGFNYDSGYLEITNKAVNSFSVTGGLGLPIGRSRLNISYTYKNGGSLEGFLIQEVFNTLNINFSLRDIWFLQRKVN